MGVAARSLLTTAEACKHPLKHPPEVLVDATGETVMVYECLICGAQFGLSLNSEGEVERMMMLPPAGKCAWISGLTGLVSPRLPYREQTGREKSARGAEKSHRGDLRCRSWIAWQDEPGVSEGWNPEEQSPAKSHLSFAPYSRYCRWTRRNLHNESTMPTILTSHSCLLNHLSKISATDRTLQSSRLA